MIKKSAYRPVGFRVPQNYVDKIEPKGVDFSSPQMEADKDRGVYSINYRYNGKKGEKRWGYQKVGYVPEGTDHNPIFGMWSFVGGVTNTKRTIAIAGKNFYEATYDGRWHFTKVGELDETPVGITKESAISVGYYLYLLAGGKMYRFSENENEEITVEEIGGLNAYIPTTTTLISPSNAATAPSSGASAYEEPNLISPWRKNTFIGGVEIAQDGGSFPYYELDTRIADLTEASRPNTKLVINGKIVGVASDYPTTTVNNTGAVTAHNIGFYNIVSGIEGEGELRSAAMILSDGEARKVFFIDTNDSMSGGSDSTKYYIAKSYDRYYIGKGDTLYKLVAYTYRERRSLTYWIDGKDYLVLVADFPNELQGSDNIILQFPAATPLDNPIKKCRYFAKFGHNNKLNTAWVYGNPDKPNYVWNSRRPEQNYEIDNEVHDADEDFTYWPAAAYRKLGEPNSKIVGAEVVSETKMMVLKTKGGSSPTMYFISPIIVTKDMDGDSETTNDSYTIAEYSTFQSNTSTAGIVPTPDGICNLNGDILFFSNEKQVAGLDIEGITGDSRRAANTRSAYIDRELAKLDPASVKLFAFGNYLILDSDTQTYCCHLSQYNAETRQYEWWAIDNINATFFYEDDDGNAFYTDDKGGIYLLANSTIDETGRSKKVDIERYFINQSTGDLGFSIENSFITTSTIVDRIREENGWKFKFNNAVYGIFGHTDILDYVGHFKLKEQYANLNQYFLDGKTIVGIGRQTTVIDRISANIGLDSSSGQVLTINHTASADGKAFITINDFRFLNYYTFYLACKTSSMEDYTKIAQVYQTSVLPIVCEIPLEAGETLESVKAYFGGSGSWQPSGYVNVSAKIYEADIFGEYKISDYDSESTEGRLFEIVKVSGDNFQSGMLLGIALNGEYEVEAVENEDKFKLANEDFVEYVVSNGGSFTGEFSKETPIQSMWISRPVPIGKFTYDKTIKQVDVYNDTQEPAELYIGCITNKQLHTYQYARIEAFDLGNIDFENTTFTQKRVPVIYHMKRFPRKHQYFSLVQMSTGTDNSLLSDMDITYTLQGVARNKK